MIRKAIAWFRSAITGRFVSKADAEAHPETTVKERKSPVSRKGRAR